MQVLDKQDYDEIREYENTPARGMRLSKDRPLSKKLVYAIGGLVVLILVGALALRSHVLPGPFPRLDPSTSVVNGDDGHSVAAGQEQEQGYRKAVVIASYADQDLTWLADLDSNLTKGWEVYRYVGDGKRRKNKQYLTVPNSDGRESLAYLTFIVDHYDDLPDYVVFIHGHDRAWHQPEHIIDKLAAINLEALRQEQFFNLRCPTSPGCEADTKFYYDGTHADDHRAATFMAEFWKDKMQDNFGPLPPVVGRRCCAQFAASRDAILRQPRMFWRQMRRPLVDDPRDQREAWREGMSGHRVGLYYENIWHIMMAKPADYCPSTEHCVKVHFQDKIHCDRDITTWDDRAGWESIVCHNSMREASA